MPDLIAQGSSKAARWRKGLPEIASGRVVLLGREPKVDHGTSPQTRGDSSQAAKSDRHEIPLPWAVPWDASISRNHATLAVLANDRLEVTRDSRARNPIFHRGRPQERFVVVPGEHFVIGETTFTLARRPGFTDEPPRAASVRLGGVHVDDSSVDEETQHGGDTPQAHYGAAHSSGEDVTEMAFAESFLRNRDFRDTGARIQLLARLPDLVSGSVDEEELLVRVTDVMLRATPAASAVAIVRANATSTGAASEMQVLHYDTRDASTAEQDVSARLVATTLKRRESVLHLWENAANESPDYTVAENVDWAFCVPLRSEACHGWAIYVAGSRTAPSTAEMQLDDSVPLAERISDDMKFAEVVGSLVSGIRQAAQFQQRHAAMRRFFAPVVLDALAGEDAQNWLQPRECDLSVMFCDLRGFSQTSEVHSDQLLLLLEQVSAALGVMTRHILDTGGVIGDFHGDAAMGFWGWPLPLAQESDALRASAVAAAQAAAAIRKDYATEETDFRCGIGIASGSAVAGRIGTVDQVKVTAFGPVVNLASRLEGLTKAFGVEILVDQTTAEHLSQSQTPDEPTLLPLRRLGRVRVAGMKTPVDVHQLVVPIEGQPMLTNQQIETYQAAWDSFASGDWDDAYQQLHELPAWDRPKDVLLRLILQHHRTAPPDWDGILDFPKS